MGTRLITSVDARVRADREQELLDGFGELIEGDQPDGLLRSELLRGPDCTCRVRTTWRVQTTWRDIDALRALRRSGKPPAVLGLLDRLAAQHSHSVFTVEQSHEA